MSFSGDLYPTAGADVVMTTSGDMVKYQSGARARLGIGSANQLLQVKSSLPSWETVDLADTVLTTAGDVLFENATPELARLPKGTDADVLTLASGLPSWVAPSGGGIWTGVTASATSLQSELTVDVADTPDIVQILFNVCGDDATNGKLSFRVNNVSSASYNARTMGFSTTFDYDAFTSQTQFPIDRNTNTHNRCGEILLFKGNSNFNNGTEYGNVGVGFRSMSSEIFGGATGSSSYNALAGGANESLASDITSIQVLLDDGDIMGNIQVNSMDYQ
jgi:hypothetical protein